VELDETVLDENIPSGNEDINKYNTMSLPGGPFLFGALLAFLALLITMSLPEATPLSKVDIKKKTDIDNDISESGFVNQDLSPLLSDSIA